jgi:hypothetical protein
VFDEHVFELRIKQLISDGQEPEAERELLKVNRVDDANQVFGEMLAMLAMTKPGGQGRPCGDELNFLSAAAGGNSGRAVARGAPSGPMRAAFTIV